MFDYAAVEAEILIPYSAIHEKVAKLMAKEEALGETIEILKRGPKDQETIQLQDKLKKIRQLSEKQFKCMHKQRRLLGYLSMHPELVQ